MNQDNKRSSLLPLLDLDQTGFRLTLAPVPRAGSFPFAATPAAGPLAHLVDAALTCGQTEFGQLALLIQKDSYTEAADGMKRLTNVQVDNLWQECRKFHLRPANPGRMVDLAGAEGSFEPFEALFYCRQKQTFFHPPCPACGKPLGLCTDDEILKKAGLPPYSESLRRFMYCPDCGGGQTPGIFYSRQLAGNEPEHVLDCKALTDSWQVLVKKDTGRDLPCHGCDRASECHGPGGKAAENLVPFSFYPFHVLAFRDLQLNLEDFLPLLGGGSLDTAQMTWPGRQNRIEAIKPLVQERRMFLYSRPDQRWLEILHLKLCLLADLVQQVEAAGNIINTGLSPWSIQSFWIRLAPLASGLPLLWQFETALVDLVGKPVGHGLEENLAKAYRRQFMAGAWFYVLLANSGQGAEEIMTALEEVAAGAGRSPQVFDPERMAGWNPVFSPGRIFWQPREVEPDRPGRRIWSEALELGLDLLKAGMGQEEGFEIRQFMARLADLRGQTRIRLLPGTKETEAHPAPQEAGREENRILASLVADIRRRWATTEPDQDGDWQETIVLSRAGTGQAGPAPGGEPDTTVAPEKTPPLAPEAELEKTVVLGSEPGRQEPDELAETVILKTGPRPSQLTAEPEIELEKTVVQGQGALEQDKPESELEKTVVLNKKAGPEPEKRAGQVESHPSRSPEGDQDDLEATLVLKPGESNNRKTDEK